MIKWSRVVALALDSLAKLPVPSPPFFLLPPVFTFLSFHSPRWRSTSGPGRRRRRSTFAAGRRRGG